MKVEMVMPQMGESIAEATISRWLKGPGDPVEKDEIILEISTDKVDSEIPSPASGTVAEILFQEGDVVPVKEKIAVIDTEGSSAQAGSNGGQVIAADTPVSEPEAPAAENTPSSPPAAAQTATTQTNGAGRVAAASGSGKFFSPLVRSLAESRGVSLAELEGIPGSGRGGRVTKQDLMQHLEQRGEAREETIDVSPPAASATPPPAEQPAAKPAAPPAEYRPPEVDIPGSDWGADGTRVVPMDNMRRLIADHMVKSKHTSPHVYSVQEVDVSKVAAWRARNKAEFRKREGFNLSFTPFFLEAAVRGLLQFPTINASVEGSKVILKRNVNLGCAVALGKDGTGGLIVPVIKQAEERNFVGIARALNDLALRARGKKLMPDEVMGGTFTVTNPGVFGTMIGTPIINQPQLAILCLGAIKKRPVVIDDMIAIREICYLTLSYDHRVVDGSMGGQYLAFVREYLENWDMDRTLY